MKKILVTSNIKYDKYGNLQNLISQDWFQFLNRLGFSVFTTGIINDKQIKSELTKINGVIFSGGNDLFFVNKKRENRLRDNYEKKLLKICIKKKITTLAVCRGFQLINSLYKGNLDKLSGHVKTFHNLKISNNSKFVKFKSLKVNSYHNYCLTNVSKNFEIVSRAKDSSIEIAEHTKYKILCLMFHPERYNPSQKKINKLIKDFF